MPDEMKQRRFPRPWDIEEINKAAFVVRDNNGTALAYVYFEDEPGRAARLPVCSRAMRRGGLLSALLACPSCSKNCKLCAGDSASRKD
jgi:hypothetical protein